MDNPKTVQFIVQVACVMVATQTVPFIGQSACIRGPQTVPSPSYLGIHARDSYGRVSVLPLFVPALIFIFGQPTSPGPRRILDANLPLAPAH